MFSQLAISSYLSRHDWLGQVKQFREMYRERRDAMLAALTEKMPAATTWTRPGGGFYVWLTLPDGLDAKAMLPRAVTARVAYVPGTAFFSDGFGSQCMRLSYCHPTPERITEGVARLAAVINEELELRQTFGPLTAWRRAATTTLRVRSLAKGLPGSRLGLAGGSGTVPVGLGTGARPESPTSDREFLMSDLGRVLVLAGGLSHERDVSLRSGRRVADALRSVGVEVEQRDVDAGLVERLRNDPPDAVFPVLHGVTGEDGALRQVLDLYGVPYVGADAAACRTAFDKPVAATMVGAAGLHTPESVVLGHDTFRELGAAALMEAVVGQIGLPLVVKPARGGSALGASIVRSADELPAAMVNSYAYGPVALIERYVDGDRGGRHGRRHRRWAAGAACRGDPARFRVLRLRGALYGWGDAVRRTGSAGCRCCCRLC